MNWQKKYVRPIVGTTLTIKINLDGHDHTYGFVDGMRDMAGKTVTITEITGNIGHNICITIEEDEGYWGWHPLMFEETKHYTPEMLRRWEDELAR